MRRKFLYFKIFDLKEHPKEIEILSALEIENLVGPVTPIDNIFQLSQQPEVKRIIEKDIILQNALTDTLPRRGRHGYLWVGDNLPDIVSALSRLSYIKEVFLFQQLLEPEPDFVKKTMRNMTFLEFNVYLWRVYKFWTQAFFLNRALYISTTSKNESEIDEKFKMFREELGKPPGKTDDRDPALMISYAQDITLKNLSVDQRFPAETYLDNRWIRALVNTVSGPDEKYIYLPFAANGTIAQEGLLCGYKMQAEDLNPVNTLMTKVAGNLTNVDLTEYNRLVMEIQSKIKMLMNANAATQTDLFLYSAEGQFLNFWETEKKRLKSLSPQTPVDEIQKYIAATRFLIQSETITKARVINDLFAVALVNLMASVIRKKEKIDFYDSYRNALYEIYLKLYVLSKLNSFYTFNKGETTVKVADSLNPDDQLKNISGIVTFLPAKIAKNGFDKDRFLITNLNLHGAVEKLEHMLTGGKYIKSSVREEIEAEIKNHEGFYKNLPKEAHDVLARLELMGRQDEVVRYTLLWRQYLAAFAKFYNVLEENGKICLVIENPEVRADKTTVIIPVDLILQKLIENLDNYKLDLQRQFSKNLQIPKTTNPKQFRVLIYKKVG
ncbi:MAG: hypothetical protein H6627_13040 [Calditrichae bacterium]|nr:hypothetical protein [Calditrichota bacterium]MCB9059490.1 hypothetical protein [Calditrichia bacterium]